MRLIVLFFFLSLTAVNGFAQTAPTPRPLPSPTPFPTPSDFPTPDDEGTITPTVQIPLEEFNNYVSTMEAELEKPVLIQPPASITFLANLFGFLKWFAANDRALLGPFAPLMGFLLFMTPIALFLMVAYVGNLIVTVIWSIVSDIFKKIADLIPG